MKSMASNDKPSLSNRQKSTYKIGKAAPKELRRYEPQQTKAFRLVGNYYWIIGKQKKASKWLNKAVKKGEELSARPDLSRTYFEIGKALLDPKCKYKEWNGITAREYLNKARTMFQEMDLQYDLDELDKIAANT